MTTVGFTCDTCGNCCRHHRVPVTLADLARLISASEEGFPITSQVELISDHAVDMSGEPESLAQVRQGRRLLVLKHKNHDQEKSACIFLSKSGLCEKHASRPLSCRSYPFDRPEKSETTSLGLHPEFMCPSETGVLYTLRNSQHTDRQVDTFLRLIQLRDIEAHAHALWIQEWNTRQRVRLKMGRVPDCSEKLFLALEASARRSCNYDFEVKPRKALSRDPT